MPNSKQTHSHGMLTHVDETGAAKMVDVGDKPVTRRTARARAVCVMQPATAAAIRDVSSKKGDVLQVARIAALSAAKRTDELIPLCHSVPIDSVSVEFNWENDCRLQVVVSSIATGKTGVEMEAMVAATIGALTVYDMCKAMDRGMRIEAVELLEKTGGVRGDYALNVEPTSNE